MDKKYLLTSLGYAILGLILGIYMAASKNHGQMVTHAHIMLLGFVVSFIYASIFKIWIKEYASRLAVPQFICHQVGTLFLLLSLFCLFGGFAPESMLRPILAISSIIVLLGMILMKIIVIKAIKNT